MTRNTSYPESVKAGKPILHSLPNGWEQKTLDNYLNLESRKVNLLNDQEYDLVTVKRSRGGVVRREHLLGRNISVKTQFYIKEGDFLISKRQIVHGACGIVPKELDGSIVSNEYSVFTAKENFYLPYLEYLSETLYFQQVCFHSSIGVHIEKMIFKLETWFKWSFNIPPLAEQKKIAQILSTWDKAILATEKLLKNSQQQKKALIQQLLTGKKRLLDENGVRFSGAWKEYPLGNLGNTFTGLTGKTKEDFGSGVPYITYMNIFKNNRIDINQVDYVIVKEDENQNSVRYGDIFFTTSSETAEEVGMSSVLLEEVERLYLNSFCFGFRLNNFKVLLPQFAAFILRSSNIRKQISILGQGATRYNLSKNQLMKLILKLPTIAEQKKIAEVLTLSDQEIETLQKKLDCLKQEKKALMQQLLTGKRRVLV